MTDPGATVGPAAVTAPKTHPAVGTTVAQARAALADPRVHLVLLVEGDRLTGTLSRGDVAGAVDGDAPAAGLATLDGRTVDVDAPLADARALLAATGARRLAVVDADGRLRGLLCLRSDGVRFCTDAGVAARACDPR